MIYFDIFVGFFRSGILGYGGGPSTIPLVRKEVVEKYQWLSDEEFGEILAIGNTLPGPIATKMAGYIGYRVKGILGMLIALAATVLPTVVIMIGLLFLVQSYTASLRVQNMIHAVIPVVGIMMAELTYDFFKKSYQNLGRNRTIILSVICALSLTWLNIHPAILIGLFLVYGLLLGRKESSFVDTTEKQNISG